MKILLVGDANSIFLIDYTKWLKKTINVEIHIFSIGNIKYIPAELPYDKIYFNDYNKSIWSRIKLIRTLLYPFITSNSLKKVLIKNQINYDIIDYQWVAAYSVLNINRIKQYAQHLFLTSWGKEWDNFSLLFSNKLYKKQLFKLLNTATFIVSTTNETKNALSLINPSVSTKYRYGTFGSNPLEKLYEIIECESKNESKKHFSINPDKISVAIGYSGKALHRHIEVIRALINSPHYNSLKEKIILVLPMNYGCGKKYILTVKNELIQSGFEFVVFDNYWEPIDVARFRTTIDVVLQLSSSDAVSRSILEFMTAGSIIISGNWINYQYFKDEGFNFIEVNDNGNAISELYKIVNDFEKYKILFATNIEMGKNKYLWKECIKGFLNNYQEALNQKDA